MREGLSRRASRGTRLAHPGGVRGDEAAAGRAQGGAPKVGRARSRGGVLAVLRSAAASAARWRCDRGGDAQDQGGPVEVGAGRKGDSCGGDNAGAGEEELIGRRDGRDARERSQAAQASRASRRMAGAGRARALCQRTSASTGSRGPRRRRRGRPRRRRGARRRCGGRCPRAAGRWRRGGSGRCDPRRSGGRVGPPSGRRRRGRTGGRRASAAGRSGGQGGRLRSRRPFGGVRGGLRAGGFVRAGRRCAGEPTSAHAVPPLVGRPRSRRIGRLCASTWLMLYQSKVVEVVVERVMVPPVRGW